MTDISDLREMKPRITVFGVGGAGGNAVNNMITAGLQGVDFVVANTDAQALAQCRKPNASSRWERWSPKVSGPARGPKWAAPQQRK